MLMKQPTTSKTYQRLVLLSSLLLLLSMIACDCRNPEQIDDGRYGGLNMQVSPTNLAGEIKTTKITITPDPSKGPVDLTKYKIKINFTDTEGT